MGGERLNAAVHADQALPKIVFIDSNDVTSSAVYLASYEQIVKALANTASGDYTLYLPPIAEMDGKIVTIDATIANSKTITLADLDDSDDWGGDYTLDADNDRIMLYAAAGHWYVPDNQIA